ncbi:histidinol-phosphate transaminase [soil metagenome]
MTTATSPEAATQPFDLATLVRSALRSTPGYAPAVIPPNAEGRQIKLDMNESPYGPSPKTKAAVASFVETNRYPDFEQLDLRIAIGRYIGRSAEQIICGAGLDDVLNTMFHALIEDGDEVIISEPTFGVYRALVSVYGGVTVNAPLSARFALDPEEVLSRVTGRTKVIVICSPNNPTGNILDPDSIETIVEHAPCLVAIDEAYAEFGGVSHLDLLDKYPNVAVFRTMSKFAGLAGMRVGYGVFPEAMMPYLRPVTPAFQNISMVSRVAAIASLSDLEHLEGVVSQIVDDRDSLSESMAAIPGVQPLPSATNFILAKLPVADAAPIVAELARRGVFVRHFARPELGIVDCLRVTVGTTDENQIFLDELTDIVNGLES